MRRSTTLPALAVLMGIAATQAAAIPIPFTGIYDEDQPGVGDYDVLGGTTDVGDFAMIAGTNTFKGSIYSPVDTADVFNIVVGTYQTLESATITFAENANAFNPYFGFPPPLWGLFESSTTPTIFNQQLGPSSDFSQFSPLTYTFNNLAKGTGTYNMLIGNGVFGMNNGGGVDYTMSFTVSETLPPPPPPPPPTPAVPLPAGLPLLLAGLGAFGLISRKRKS